MTEHQRNYAAMKHKGCIVEADIPKTLDVTRGHGTMLFVLRVKMKITLLVNDTVIHWNCVKMIEGYLSTVDDDNLIRTNRVCMSHLLMCFCTVWCWDHCVMYLFLSAKFAIFCGKKN